MAYEIAALNDSRLRGTNGFWEADQSAKQMS